MSTWNLSLQGASDYWSKKKKWNNKLVGGEGVRALGVVFNPHKQDD